MSSENDKFEVYKSVSPDCRKWFIFSGNPKHLIWKTDFGGLVFQTLNTINHVLNNDVKSKNEETIEYMKILQANKSCAVNYYEIREALSNKITDIEQKFKIYNAHKFFSLAFFQREFDKIYEKLKSGEAQYDIEKNIVFNDNELYYYHGAPILCEKYTVTADLSWLFILDLREALFNRSINPKVCAQCGDFFIPHSGKNKYCDDCNKEEAKQKRRYRQRHEDPVQHLRQRIIELILYRGKNTWYFTQKMDLYGEIIHNQKIDDKYYANIKYDKSIKTEDDLIKWLTRIHSGMTRKKVQNGKTDEKSERNRSDNQSIGKTQETVPSDDNAGLER